jgi:multicomponent Na+:H+ antiporter subunit C
MDLLSFAIERYNYWIFITLMMIGLFIVIARGNLLKKMIGLNVFQTSVFIYYISIGKIAGGTAPIYLPEDYKARLSGAHGAEPLPGKDEPGAGAIRIDESLHDRGVLAGNDLQSLTAGATRPESDALHGAPAGTANDILAAPSLTIEDHAGAAVAAHDAARAAAEIVYSNPLPHVLILTAIVVGIATTAVGLALIVRIREAYGTIEEDELEAADDIAEFGYVPSKRAPAAAGADA